MVILIKPRRFQSLQVIAVCRQLSACIYCVKCSRFFTSSLFCFVSRAPSSVARTARLTLCQCIYFFSFFVFRSQYLPRLPSRSSPNLPGRWQMCCNRKVKLFVSELFRGREGRSKRSLSLRTQLHKMQHGVKMDLLTEKKTKLSDFGHITRACTNNCVLLLCLIFQYLLQEFCFTNFDIPSI